MPDYGDIDPNTGQTNERTQWGGTVDPYAPSVANGQITPAQWAEYQARRKRDAILGVLGVIGGTSAASGLASAIFGGGGAAGAAASGSAGAGAATGAGSLAPVAGGAPWAVTPYAGTAMSVPTGAAAVGGTVGAGALGAAGATAAAEGAKKYLGLTTRDWLDLAGAGLGTAGALTADKPNTNLDTSTIDPQMKALLELMAGRLRKSEPLFDSVQSMANGLLPTQYQKGGGGMT